MPSAFVRDTGIGRGLLRRTLYSSHSSLTAQVSGSADKNVENQLV